MIRSSIACIALLIAGSAAAQIFECIDAKGNKTIAQFCPPGTVKETKLMKSGAGASPATSAPAAKTTAEKEVDFRKRTLERQDSEAKSDKEKGDAKVAEQNCLDARAQLRQLEDGMRIMRSDPVTGERSYLQDADRPAEVAKARQAVDNWCKK
jgi:hypothetical protein